MKRIAVSMVVTGLLVAPLAQALEVDREVMPRITLGGRVVGTLDFVDLDSDPGRENSISHEDSSLSLRLDKRLYTRGVAGALLSFREDDDEVHFGDHYVFFWNRYVEVLLGHAPLRNKLIEFPTLRDDDLLSATHVGNASSDGNFEQTHGDMFSVDGFVGDGHALGIWAGSRLDGPGMGVEGLDSAGLSYIYQPPETLRYVRRVRRFGVLLDRQKVDAGVDTEWMKGWVAGLDINLTMNPVANWSMEAQLVDVAGAGAVDLATVAGRARAQSRSLAAAIRYTARPALLTRWQAAVTVAYTDYSDVDDAVQWSVTPNFLYRLGEGVDLLAQYHHVDHGSGLGGGDDRSVQIGLAFSLDARFNDTIGERNSILNREHGYIR
jgi:hypothetical protein